MQYESKDEISDTNATLGFGDGGGAIILQACEEECGIETRFKTCSEYWNEGVIWGGGSMYLTDSDKFYMRNIKSEVVQKNTIRAVKFYFDSMNETNIKVKDVDLFITTQMGKYPILRCADALKIPHDKIVVQCDYLGNTAAASMPSFRTMSAPARSDQMFNCSSAAARKVSPAATSTFLP